MQLRAGATRKKEQARAEIGVARSGKIGLEGSGAGRLVARVGPCVPVGCLVPERKFPLGGAPNFISLPDFRILFLRCLPASLRFAFLRLHRLGESAA